MQVRMLARGLTKLTPPLQRSLRSSITTSVNVLRGPVLPSTLTR